MRGLSKNILVFGRFDKKKKMQVLGGSKKFMFMLLCMYIFMEVLRGAAKVFEVQKKIRIVCRGEVFVFFLILMIGLRPFSHF